MGHISQIAGLYALLFVVSLIWFNEWLSIIAGLLGMFLVVALALMLDNIDETKTEHKWVVRRMSTLEEEIKELRTRLKEHEEKKGRIELL